MNPTLFKAIQKELNLTQYTGETSISYKRRLLFCACAQWMRVFVLDQNERGESYPKSKKYLLQRGRETISPLINAFSECSDWFSSESEEWPYKTYIRDLRESMIATGELLINAEGNICIPSYNKKALFVNVDRITGMNMTKAKGEMYVGITKIAEVSAREDPYRLRIDSKVFVEELFSKSAYSSCNDIEQYEFFNPYSKKALYQAWDSAPNRDTKIAFGRRQIINGLQEYYLFRRRRDGRWENARLQDFYKERGEQRRIMLTLRENVGNQMIALYKNCGEAFLLKLFCYLPRVQEMQLRAFCWPRESHEDRLNYVVPKKLWPLVPEMCADLHIKLQETEKGI